MSAEPEPDVAALHEQARDRVIRAAFQLWMDVPRHIFARKEFQPLWQAIDDEVDASVALKNARATKGDDDGG